MLFSFMYTINHTQPSCKATGPRVMYEPLEPGQLGSSIPRHGAAVPRDLFHKPFSLTRQGTLRCSLAGHTSGYYLFYNSIIFRAKKHEKSFIWGSAIYNMMRVESCCILPRYSQLGVPGQWSWSSLLASLQPSLARSALRSATQVLEEEFFFL